MVEGTDTQYTYLDMKTDPQPISIIIIVICVFPVDLMSKTEILAQRAHQRRESGGIMRDMTGKYQACLDAGYLVRIKKTKAYLLPIKPGPHQV